MDPFKVAHELTTNGGAYAGWFIASVEAGIIAFMYRNTIQKEIWKTDVTEIKDNQQKLVEAGIANNTTIALILEVLKSMMSRS